MSGIGIVKIGSHTYPVDLSNLGRQPLSSMRQMQDQGTEVGEQSLDNSALWRRKSDDFVLGQGQVYFDQTDENARRRMRAVSGFDPLADRRALAAAPGMTSQVAAYAGGTARAPKLLKTASNWWVVPTGTGTIKRTASLTSYTQTNVTGTTAATDATVWGSSVYIADGSSVFSGSVTGSSVSSFSTVDTDVLDSAKGRLVCGKDALLFELDSTGTQIEVFTHPNSAWDWYDFAGGNVGIYCAGHDGLRSEIYLSTLLDATGAIQPPTPVAEFPAGELVRCIEFFSGFLVIGTSRGVRVAQATQGGALNYGPLIELGDTYGVAFEDRFAYVTCSSLPVFGGPGVVKMSMDRYTAPLTPAYAATFPITAANYTAYDVGVSNEVVTCLLGNGTNVQAQNSAGTYGTSYYWSGIITYGVDEPKNWQSFEATFDALTSGQSVTLSVYTKQGGTLLATASTSGIGAESLELTGFTEILREEVELLITTVGQVTIHRWTARAVVAPVRRPEEILLPLIVGKDVVADSGQHYLLDPYEEWAYLSELMRTRSSVNMQFGNEEREVWVDQVFIQGTMERWDERGRWPQGIVVARLVTTS